MSVMYLWLYYNMVFNSEWQLYYFCTYYKYKIHVVQLFIPNIAVVSVVDDNFDANGTKYDQR